MDDNPLNLDLEEAVSIIPPAFIVNSVLNNDKEIIGLFCGHWIQAHRQACKYYHRLHSTSIKEKRGLAIVSCGGYPKDINLIQSHKTLQYSSNCLKKGGTLILLGECSDGIGSPDFLNWFPMDNINAFLKRYGHSLELNGQTAFFFHSLVSNFRIILISTLKPDTVRRMGIQPAANFDEAIDMMEEKLIKEGGYIIPQGYTTLPILLRKNNG